ncbi:MAG: hypothetical protein U0790_03130 [Isosphaeraceae bacterium]
MPRELEPERGERQPVRGRSVLLALGTVVFCLAGQSTVVAQWTIQDAGWRARFRGLHVVDGQTAWATGSAGTIVRTTDGGRHWLRRPVALPGAGEDDFRDVHAPDDRAALVLAVGPGPRSRVLKTRDGGETWSVALRNPDERGFFDAIAFWGRDRGLVQGDPVDGRFVIFSTRDAGSTWRRFESSGMPPAQSGEGAFAASGTSLVVQGIDRGWFGTGGAARSRVFRSDDGGTTWGATETPIDAGSPSAGIFSLAFRDALHGVAVGGDYRQPEKGGKVCARTEDGGRTWTLPRGPEPRAFRSAVAYIPGSQPPTLIAVGPTGAEVSSDDGKSWKPLGSLGFHATSFAGPEAGWAVGEDGRIGRFSAEYRR